MEFFQKYLKRVSFKVEQRGITLDKNLVTSKESQGRETDVHILIQDSLYRRAHIYYAAMM